MSTQILNTIFQKQTNSLIKQSPGAQSGYITPAEEAGDVSPNAVQPSLDSSRADVPLISATPGNTALKIRDPYGGREPLTFLNYRISQVFATSDSGKLVIQGFNPETEFISADCINAGNRNQCPTVVSMQRYAKQSAGVMTDLTMNSSQSGTIPADQYKKMLEDIKPEPVQDRVIRETSNILKRPDFFEGSGLFDKPDPGEALRLRYNITGTTRSSPWFAPVLPPLIGS